MTTLFVESLEFWGYHGVTEEERKTGCRMRLDIHAEVVESAGATDSIDDTVDYGALVSCALKAASEGPFQTLERAISHVAAAIHAQYPPVATVVVGMVKDPVAFGIAATAIGVRKAFTRGPA